MNAPRTDKMKLGAFFHPTGNHVASWLHPQSQIDAGTNFRHYAQLAQTAERAKFDLVFLADSAATRAGKLDTLRHWPQYMVFFDPLTLLAGLAAVTSHIGLVATATTSYNEPYNIARRLAALDHMSGGRAGWNVVTSSNISEAYNFNRDAPLPHGERYERAMEFTDVVKGLLDSWDDDAFIRDRDSAIYFDPDKLHALNHCGKHFQVRGPLNAARPPQGYPVFAQAGVSDTAQDMAARQAEIVFTPLHTLEGAQALYRDLKARAVAYGREPDHIKLMPGLNPVVGRTEAEAEEKHQYLQSLIHPDVGRALLSTAIGEVDLSACKENETLPPPIRAAALATGKTDARHVVDMWERDGLTLRQMYQRFAGARGQRTVKGTPARIADEMETWFRGRGVDGFLVQPPVLPAGLDDFVELVVPELQKRGLFREDYEGTTLRENLGLPRPASQYQRSSP
ncbi:LLM class flavin-dependent oxidoreductase [Rhodopila sp.]|uniref:LLM class flavin-dependent oxidoreductase n=1 Tax=Rhodopila sp. TaxID=2480087 RepID=UPI003D0F189A